MSSEALVKPIITRNSSEFKLDVYASIPVGELVVFAVQVLQADATPVAVEEIVSTCFRFFPHSFALKNYFYWPDSALVARRLHDSKEKGLLKGNTTEGFETKVQGRQVAKHVAKALGVSLPIPPKVEVIVTPPVEKKEEEKKEIVPSVPVVKAVKKRETQKKEVQQKDAKSEKKQAKKPALKKQVAKLKKEVAVPTKKKSAPKPKMTAVKKPVVKVEKKEERKKKEVRPTLTVKKEAVKVTPKPKVEKKVAKKQVTLRLRAGQASKKATQPSLKPEVKKVEPKVEKKQATIKKEAKASAQPTQLTLGLNPPSAWKKVEVPTTKPKLKEEARPVKVEVFPPVAASKEEKDKAAKVIKQLERSDAYQLYRRNGKRASIGEFDFRNMLFATMESSAETLKRNVELFKRYAGIHFRTDLVAFLEFCEEHFAELLRSKEKKPLRK